MPVQVTTSLIAIVGVIIAAIISYAMSQRQTYIEIQKFRAEIKSAYGTKLYEQKLRVYPELYSYISDFIKVLNTGNVPSKSIKKLYDQWQKWDSQHAILFSGYTHGICSPIRDKVGKLAEKSDKVLRLEFAPEGAIDKFKKELQAVELSLKYELGIFALETPDIDELEREFSYDQLHAKAGLRTMVSTSEKSDVT